MKKTISLLCVVLLILAMAVGCSKETPGSQEPNKPDTTTEKPSDSDDSQSDEPYKVYFYAWTHEDNMIPITEAFNKEYEGKYELVYQKLANADTSTINTALASGEQIDVMTQASTFDLRVRADSGVYLPLNEFFEQWGTTYEEKLGKATEVTNNFDGKYYGVPYCKNIQMVYYNKNLFDEAGVEYPKPDWTWEDFREAAKKLTKGSGANKVYGAMADLQEYWPSIARQKLGEFYFYNDDFTATVFDDPAMKESLQFWYDLVMVDKTAVPMEEYTSLQYNNDVNGMIGLYQGKYAMFFVPVYGCLYTNESYGQIPEGTDIGVTYLPSPAGSSKPITTFYTSTCSIPANVKNKEAAWTLLKYICFDRADLYAGPKAMHPGYEFATEEEEREFLDLIFEHPGIDKEQCIDTMMMDFDVVSQDLSVVQGQMKINDLIKANISKVFNNEMSVDECLEDLKAKGDAYIAEDLK